MVSAAGIGAMLLTSPVTEVEVMFGHGSEIEVGSAKETLGDVVCADCALLAATEIES